MKLGGLVGYLRKFSDEKKYFTLCKLLEGAQLILHVTDNLKNLPTNKSYTYKLGEMTVYSYLDLIAHEKIGI